MQYIAHRDYRGNYLAGDEEIFIPFGTYVERKGSVIVCNDKVICTTCSLICHKFFARDDDGNGLKRGKLTYAIAYAPRHTSLAFRFTEDEQMFLHENFSHWLKDLPDAILFNDDFFDANIDDLKELADILQIGSD